MPASNGKAPPSASTSRMARDASTSHRIARAPDGLVRAGDHAWHNALAFLGQLDARANAAQQPVAAAGGVAPAWARRAVCAASARIFPQLPVRPGRRPSRREKGSGSTSRWAAARAATRGSRIRRRPGGRRSCRVPARGGHGHGRAADSRRRSQLASRHRRPACVGGVHRGAAGPDVRLGTETAATSIRSVPG